jgi:hypothetical protein
VADGRAARACGRTAAPGSPIETVSVAPVVGRSRAHPSEQPEGGATQARAAGPAPVARWRRRASSNPRT